MHNDDILILKGHEVRSLLEGRELDIIEVISRAYQAHARGQSSLPHSNFLLFPDNPRSRIIALPAYLGDDGGIAGIKWIASFPANLERGMERASAVIILNSAQTGRPQAFLEGSLISARRTAAGAALAARELHGDAPAGVGMIGCGLINYEILRFLRAVWPELSQAVVYDLDQARSRQFKEQCENAFAGLAVDVAQDVETTLGRYSLISFATTAATPHLGDLSPVAPGSVILHVSLRDLTPEVILTCDNVVDDVDHVYRAQTSIHLTGQMVGHRDFIRCALGDILLGNAPARTHDGRAVIFSPFGLGILDLALARFVKDQGRQQGTGTTIGSFLPETWLEHRE